MTSDRTEASKIAMPRLRAAVTDAAADRRPKLTAEELDQFAREIRPDAEARIEIGSLDGEPMIVVRAVVRATAQEREAATPNPVDPKLALLSRRELEVARLVAAGLTNAEIAAQLGIHVGTVKDHVHRIIERLGVRSRQGIVAMVVAAG